MGVGLYFFFTLTVCKKSHLKVSSLICCIKNKDWMFICCYYWIKEEYFWRIKAFRHFFFFFGMSTTDLQIWFSSLEKIGWNLPNTPAAWQDEMWWWRAFWRSQWWRWVPNSPSAHVPGKEGQAKSEKAQRKWEFEQFDKPNCVVVFFFKLTSCSSLSRFSCSSQK